MNRWKSSAAVAMTMVSLIGTAAHAQGTTCQRLTVMVALPDGSISYSPTFVGNCDPWGNTLPTSGSGSQPYGSGPTYPTDFGSASGSDGGITGGGQTFTFFFDYGDNNQGNSNDQGNNDQGNNPPHYTPTNDGPPSNSEFPHNDVPTVPTTTTPEPSSVILLGSGIAALAAREMRRRRRNK